VYVTVSFDAVTNFSIQNSYLLRMQVKPRPQDEQYRQEQLPFVDANPPIVDQYLRQTQQKRKLQERRQMVDGQRGASMGQMLQRLQVGRHELFGLRQQFELEQNPFKRRILETQVGYKTAGTSAIEHLLASSYNPSGGGFVGSENRIDSVGSFVTFG
jgi:hypothetical protein